MRTTRVRRAPIFIRFALPAILAAVAFAAVAFAAAATAADDPPADSRRPVVPLSAVEQERAIIRAFDRRDFARAVRLIDRYLDERPNDTGMLYNLACAHARLGDRDASTSALYRAVKAGFRDFAHMERDPDLDGIRGTEMYRAILEAADRASEERAESALDQWKRTYGDREYRYELDEQRRLAFATALEKESHDRMKAMLQAEADVLIKLLFEAPPDYYVLVAVPTPRDADALFGGDESIGGRYEHGPRRLLTRDIGSSLRHEFVHAFHYGHMERLGMREAHPIWVQEGLAALFEDYELSADGSIRFLPNDRDNIVKRRVRMGRIMRWEEFFDLPSERFMALAGRMYPLARSIFEYIAEQGHLTEWYKTYVRTWREDPTGVTAIESVFGGTITQVERDWRKWVEERPMLDTRVDVGDASLGITAMAADANDGVVIDGVVPGGAAARARLRSGDVILSLDGRETRTLRELLALLGGFEVGQRVGLRVRRGDRYFDRQVVLRARAG